MPTMKMGANLQKNTLQRDLPVKGNFSFIAPLGIMVIVIFLGYHGIGNYIEADKS